MYSGQTGRGCFRLRLQNIRQSNKPVIQLNTIRKMKNSFHSNNFIFLINAASQVLTLSNIPAQSPSASLPRPSQKVHQKGCIRLISLRSSDWKYLPDNHEIYRKLIEKVNFIDSLPFPAGWDGTVDGSVPVRAKAGAITIPVSRRILC